MSDFARHKIVAGVCIGITATAGLYYWYQQKRRQTPPLKWKPVGTMKEIRLYPIKSCGGIEIDYADCTALGIWHKGVGDRMLMLIDENDEFVTGRTFPKLVLVQPRILDNQINLSFGDESVQINLDLKNLPRGSIHKAKIYNSYVDVIKCGPKYDTWFSERVLGKKHGLSLVYYANSVPTRNIVSDEFKNGVFLKSDTGALQDVSSYMLIHENSMEDLNRKLPDSSIHHTQFRGTFLVKTDEPAFAEDRWEWLKVGDTAVFRCLAPCYRCIFTNINPLSAERSPEGEPLKSLKKYRLWGSTKSPRFGVQVGLRIPGKINVGDVIYAPDM